MKFRFDLTEMQQGLIFMAGGVLILLYAFNFFQQWLNILVIVGGIALFAHGFNKIGGIEKVKALIKKEKKDFE